MTTIKILLAAILTATAAVPIAGYFDDMKAQPMTQTGAQTPEPVGLFSNQSELASLRLADQWLNSAPLTPEALRGKVVLVNFWTYSCINWRRQLPYVRAWQEKYKDKGLVVIGVHAPEFEFEKNIANVQWAVKDMKVNYPVAVDNNHAIWRAFSNQAWPALYFIDAQGRLRHQYFGEGAYEQSEALIQALLREAGATGVGNDVVEVNARGHDAAPDWNNLGSPENYVGFEHTRNFASPGGIMRSKAHAYSAPEVLRLNQWALSGEWTVRNDAVTANSSGGRIAYRFKARDLHLVMGPETSGKSIRFRVSIDGKAPGTERGIDVDEQGYGTLTEQRMYTLIRQSGTITDRQFDIEFLDQGAEAFAFAFG